MTQEEFLIVANQYLNQVNVWYTVPEPYTVLGLTVPIVNNAGQDISGYLQQATTITIQVNESPDEYATLNITQRSLLGQIGNQYYFFNVVPKIIQTVGDEEVRPGRIIFTPGINGPGFDESGYNALQGLAENIRQSEYIMQADRISYINTGAGLPTNIDQLQTNNATRAEIQDSMYSDTGWISARYEGSKLDRLTNSGADPAIQGTFFVGATFGMDVNDTYILGLQSVGVLTYAEYFFSGEGTVPKFILRLGGWRVKNEYGSDILTIELEKTGGGSETSLNIGDRFYNNWTVNSATGVEVIEIVPPSPTYTLSSSPIEAILQIKRGYSNTPREVIQDNATLHKISPIQVYSIEGSTVQPAKQGKLIVKGMDEVLYIDVNGYVIGGSNVADAVVS